MQNFFQNFQDFIGNAWIYGGAFLLVLSVLVFVHEWGHYIVARLCGVRVETFSIGFGKEIGGFNDRHGTRWKFSMIPLGGYVKMFGDVDPASARHTDEIEDAEGHVRHLSPEEKSVAFYNKPVAQRAAVVFAGPAINFLFAIVILSGLYAVYGQPVTPPLAAAIIQGSAADKAGFQPHDKILSINGDPIDRFEDVRRTVMIGLDTPLTFRVERGGETVELVATPEVKIESDRFGFKHSRGMLGILGPGNGLAIRNISAVNGKAVADEKETRQAILAGMGRDMVLTMKAGAQDDTPDSVTVRPTASLNGGLLEAESPDYSNLIISNRIGNDYVKLGVFGSIWNATRETFGIATGTLQAMWQMLSGTRSATEMGGIIRIGAMAGDMAQIGMVALITFAALLSINLGLINLFPIPMLDGGHLVFYIVEAIRGAPIPDRIQEYAFRLGLAILVGIMLFANLNDIVQLIL